MLTPVTPSLVLLRINGHIVVFWAVRGSNISLDQNSVTNSLAPMLVIE